jgi:hypothetical protein
VVFEFVVDDLGAGCLSMSVQAVVVLKCVNEEQTACLKTALLHAARDARVVRTQMRTAQRGSIHIAWLGALRLATKG